MSRVILVKGWSRFRRFKDRILIEDLESVGRLNGDADGNLVLNVKGGEERKVRVSAPGIWRMQIEYRLRRIAGLTTELTAAEKETAALPTADEVEQSPVPAPSESLDQEFFDQELGTVPATSEAGSRNSRAELETIASGLGLAFSGEPEAEASEPAGAFLLEPVAVESGEEDGGLMPVAIEDHEEEAVFEPVAVEAADPDPDTPAPATAVAPASVTIEAPASEAVPEVEIEAPVLEIDAPEVPEIEAPVLEIDVPEVPEIEVPVLEIDVRELEADITAVDVDAPLHSEVTMPIASTPFLHNLVYQASEEEAPVADIPVPELSVTAGDGGVSLEPSIRRPRRAIESLADLRPVSLAELIRDAAPTWRSLAEID